MNHHDVYIPPTTLKVAQKPPVLPPPAPPKPPPAASRLVESSGWVWLLRGVILLVCLGSIWLVYWSLAYRLQPASRQSRQTSIELSRLADTVEKLRIKWNEADKEQTEKLYQEARGLLFATEDDLVKWQKEVNARAESFTLEAKCQLGLVESYPGLDRWLAHIPAQIQVQPMSLAGVTNSPYRQLVRFTEVIARSPKRFDLVELSVSGNSNSVNQVTALAQLLTEQSYWK